MICRGLEDSTFTVCGNCGLPYCDDCAEDLNSVCFQCGVVLTRGAEGSESSVEVYTYRKEK